MNLYKVVLAVARAAELHTGREIIAEVAARGTLDAALVAEESADATLCEPDIEYTHALSVVPLNRRVPAIPVAA